MQNPVLQRSFKPEENTKSWKIDTLHILLKLHVSKGQKQTLHRVLETEAMLKVLVFLSPLPKILPEAQVTSLLTNLPQGLGIYETNPKPPGLNKGWVRRTIFSPFPIRRLSPNPGPTQCLEKHFSHHSVISCLLACLHQWILLAVWYFLLPSIPQTLENYPMDK